MYQQKPQKMIRLGEFAAADIVQDLGREGGGRGH